MAKLKILFATSEVAPLIKTGGLADVSAALPAALRDLGLDVRVIVPGYPQLMLQLPRYVVKAKFEALPGFPAARLLSARLANGLPLLVLDCPALYQRSGGPYQDDHGRDWADNALRFGLLCKVTALLSGSATPLAWRPDVLHANDWQTGLAPAYMLYAPGSAPSVYTIHNLAFQGIFPAKTSAQLDLPAASFAMNGTEYYGNLSFLKAGVYYASHITTVSPSYAKEIQGPALGFGMHGLLSARNKVLTGILNGIDTEAWNPASDPHLFRPYSIKDMAGKGANKEKLQSAMGLRPDRKIPLLGVISRFTAQKGLDLLLDIAPQLTELPVQLVMLGSGDSVMQETALELSRHYPGKIGVHIGFNEALAHQIEAGADMFLMPSRFEPCGLNQMYSQRYGTPPIVHATGGLADSVVDYTETTLKAGTASGFSFTGMQAEKLYATVLRAVTLYHDKKNWRALCVNCMTRDIGWQKSAQAYCAVYEKLCDIH